MKEFEEIWGMMGSLWPHADLGDGPGLKGLYRKKLKGFKRLDLLEMALEDVRTNYSSKTPELKWIRERYFQLLREWEDNREKASSRPTEQSEAEYMKEVEESRERISFNLSLLTEDEMATLRKEMRSRPFLCSMAGGLHGPPGSWTHFSRGMAWALHTSLLSDQSRDPSPDPGHQGLLGE